MQNDPNEPYWPQQQPQPPQPEQPPQEFQVYQREQPQAEHHPQPYAAHFQPPEQHYQQPQPEVPKAWEPPTANTSLYEQPEYHAPAPVPELMPQPVVNVLSPRGVEYVFMALTLLGSAIGAASLLITFITWQIGFNALAFPISLLVVSLPAFAWLFLRLKKAELNNPALALDASKRRTTQSIQIFSFVISFFAAVGFVGTIFGALSGDMGFGDLLQLLASLLVVIGIAGGILAYYWQDEHKAL